MVRERSGDESLLSGPVALVHLGRLGDVMRLYEIAVRLRASAPAKRIVVFCRTVYAGAIACDVDASDAVVGIPFDVALGHADDAAIDAVRRAFRTSGEREFEMVVTPEDAPDWLARAATAELVAERFVAFDATALESLEASTWREIARTFEVAAAERLEALERVSAELDETRARVRAAARYDTSSPEAAHPRNAAVESEGARETEVQRELAALRARADVAEAAAAERLHALDESAAEVRRLGAEAERRGVLVADLTALVAKQRDQLASPVRLRSKT